MRHDFAGESDVADLRYRTGIHEKGDVDGAVANLVERLGGVAKVGKVLLVADGFFGKFEHAFEQAFVELHDVERLLALREASEEWGGGRLWRVQQQSAVGGDD